MTHIPAKPLDPPCKAMVLPYARFDKPQLSHLPGKIVDVISFHGVHKCRFEVLKPSRWLPWRRQVLSYSQIPRAYLCSYGSDPVAYLIDESVLMRVDDDGEDFAKETDKGKEVEGQ